MSESEFKFDEEKKKDGTNLHGKSDCPTCGGDRFVLVARRPAKASVWMQQHKIVPPDVEGMEEYAACPDCNSKADTSHSRPGGGKKAEALDPATVRERMQL